MEAQSPLPRKALINLYLITGIYFCTVAFMMQFPRYVLKIGGTAQDAGLLIAIGLLPTLFLGPAIGDWVRRVGTRKPAQAGLAIAILASLLMLTVSSVGAWMYVIRLIAAFGHTIVFVTLITSGAILVDNPVQRTQVIGWLAVVIQLGNAVGGMVGEWAYQAGITSYWMACAAITLVVFILSIWSSSHTTAPDAAGQDGVSGKAASVAWPAELWALAAVGMAFAGLSQFIPTYIEELGKTGVIRDVFAAAWFLTPALLVIATVRLVGGYYAARLLRPQILFACHGMLLATIVLLPWMNSRPEAIVLALMFGLSYGWLYPALSSLAFSNAPAEARGRISGRVVIAFEIGYRIGPIGLGALITQAGYQTMFFSMAAAYLLILALGILASRRGAFGLQAPTTPES